MTDTTIAPPRVWFPKSAPPPANSRVRALSGPTEIRRAGEQLLAESRHERLVSLCPDDETGGRLHGALGAAVAAPVLTRRLVGERSVVGDALVSLRAQMAHGLLARVVPELPANFLLVDRRVALLVLGGERAALAADPLVVGLLTDLFERAWAAGAELAVRVDGESPALSTRQREIGELLSAGHTDESVARRLGVSVRTVRAEVAALRDVLGAVSRFQAGVRYAAWHDPGC
jgi:DNA-binding CsgD family transcriptional regulator